MVAINNIKRKQDSFIVIESTMTGVDQTLRCDHCQERSFLKSVKGDNNNLFCTNCGNRTPVRTIKHSRGLAAPSIQQPTAVVQSTLGKHRTRKPQGVNRDKSELEESLLSRGYEIISSYHVEPSH